MSLACCRAAIAGAMLVAAVGCTGGIHRRGEQQFALTGAFGTPIKGNVLWPGGEGRADEAAVQLGYHYFFQDRWAFMTVVSPYRNYNQSDGDAWASELQLGFRWFFAEFDLFEKLPLGLYAEILGGLQYADISVPEEGSNANFTQDTGVGFELKLTDHISWQTGYRLRHLSNGRLFRDDSNPSQNEHLVYTGIAFSWQ